MKKQQSNRIIFHKVYNKSIEWQDYRYRKEEGGIL